MIRVVTLNDSAGFLVFSTCMECGWKADIYCTIGDSVSYEIHMRDKPTLRLSDGDKAADIVQREVDAHIASHGVTAARLWHNRTTGAERRREAEEGGGDARD